MVWDAFSVLALVASLVALVIVVSTVRRLGSRDPSRVPPLVRRLLAMSSQATDRHPAFGATKRGAARVAFIANPTKGGVGQLRESAYRACAARSFPEPMWFHTSADDPGVAAGRQAIAEGAKVLVAIGGDGTVRGVATAAAEAGIPLGIIPLGTGNLLARNLDLPLNDAASALRIALDGHEAKIDVGRLTLTRESGATSDHLFLVLAGIGLDAEMVAGARDNMKRRFGWVAYFLAGARHLGASRMRASVSIDSRGAVAGKMRTVLIANCGRLPGGVVLIPDAKFDDGVLDIATLDVRGGVAGWAELFTEVWFQGARINAPTLPDSWRVGRIDHARGTTVEVVTESPQRVQVDGEHLGRGTAIRASVQAHGLTVRSSAAQ